MTASIAFEGIDNFRDFGGYRTRHGAVMATGRLFRSGHHARATDQDLERLADLGIGVIVDLRRPNERERDVARRWPGFGGVVIDSDVGQQSLDEWQEFIARSDLTPASFQNYMLDYYRQAPAEPRHIDLYRRYFRALAEGRGGILVHCTAGKDRTGIACALTQHIAGVHDDDILHDYLLTNDPARIEARIGLVRQAIGDNIGRTPSEEAVRIAISVDAAYLAQAFEAMRERFGSIDGYLEDALGIDAALRDRIHDKLLG
ncbi:tyrosine-protein phosphatase [Phenylobacterium sp.]|uniref:tyrosine-protein phosphatase n=1 Tax=Phenylobacterium sp. TaxID=1871053 RepID=UPI00260A9A2E|nr:tyrosine-protein phosphatase [Phenylobacterium sp.]